MRRTTLLFWLLAGAGAGAGFGCGATTAPSYTSAAGSLALSRDEALLYALDTDNDLLIVLDTRTEDRVAQVKLGRAPTRLAVAPDDTIFVTNRGDRTMSVIRRDDWAAPIATLKVGVEPTSVAVSGDGRTVYVVNSTSLTSTQTGTLQAIDALTLETRWELAVGPEPRGLALVAGERAVVSLYKEGQFTLVDLSSASIVSERPSLYQQVNETRLVSGASPMRGGVSSFKARAATSVIASPDGERAYATVSWAREDPIALRPTTAGGYYAGGGPCNVGAIVAPGLVTLDASGRALVDDLTACGRTQMSAPKDYPPSTLTSLEPGKAIQGPHVAAVDPTGAWLFIANRETNNVAVVPATRREGADVSFNASGSTVRALVSVGRGPDGIALTRDGERAYVYSQFDHRLDVLASTGEDVGPSVRSVRSIVLAPDTLPEDVVSGRRLFFDAQDHRMSGPSTNVACSSCHLEGREDGHVWSFPDGLRQTPALAGRQLLSTAPYHWSGEFVSLADFMDHTIKARMGGAGLTEPVANQLAAFIDALPAADNPHLGATLSEAQARGAHAFAKAGCDACHNGATLTNNGFADVGTLIRGGVNPDVAPLGLNVPSLKGLARSAPYLHDGSAPTLRARVLDTRQGRHGDISLLTSGEVEDLVDYLQTL